MIIKYPDRIYHEFGLNSVLFNRIIQRVKQKNPDVLIETFNTRKKVPFASKEKKPAYQRNTEFWNKCKSSLILREKQQRKEHGNMRFIHDFVAVDNIPGSPEFIISMENGCPFNCYFCYLQGTLEESPLPTIFINFQDKGILLREVKIALLARIMSTQAGVYQKYVNREEQDTIHRLIGLLNDSIDQVKPNQSIEDIFKKYKKNISDNLKSTKIDKLKPFSAKLSSLKFPNSEMEYGFNCGELSDGLANDHLTDNSKFLLNLFSDPGIVIAGGYLVIRTKSDNIDNLISAKNTKNVVVSISLGPPAYVQGCATLDERLEATKDLLDSGYKVSLTLDPIIKHQNTEKVYKKILDDIKSKLDTSLLRSITFGMLRLNKNMVNIIEHRHKDLYGHYKRSSMDTNFSFEKYRYPDGVRIDIYNSLIQYSKKIMPNVNLKLSTEPESIYNATNINIPT